MRSHAPAVALLSLLLTSGVLASCGKGTKTAIIAPTVNDAADVCSSPATVNGLKRAILGAADLSDVEPAPSPAEVDTLMSQTVVTLQSPTLDSYDALTKKTTCSAVVVFDWPERMVRRLKHRQPTLSWTPDLNQGQYTIQSTTDGKGIVYSIDPTITDNISASTKMILQAIAALDRDSAPAPAPAQAKANP